MGSASFCAPDQACVRVRSFSGATTELWACATDVGCGPDGAVDDDAARGAYCGPDAERARCVRVAVDATDGSRPTVSVVECTTP